MEMKDKVPPSARAPRAYHGVEVPLDLYNNWDQPEAYWWRRGVDVTLDLKMEGFVDAKVIRAGS